MGLLGSGLKGGRASVSSDTTPDAFTFTDVSGQTEGATVTGAAVMITGINAATAFTVTGGEVQKNGVGSWLTSGTVVNNDTLTPRGTANATFLGFTNVTATVGSVADTFTIQTRADPASGIATVGAASGYTGTVGSGGSAPSGAYAWRVDSGDMTAPLAVAQIITPDLQRVSGQLLLVIPSDADGGIASVALSGDCAPTTLTGLQVTTITDSNGLSHPVYGHMAYLDAPSFVAKGGSDDTRAATIYAVVTPTNYPTIGKRLLTFTFYPAAAATDGTYGVGSGQTYSTVRAALDAARTAGKKAPYIELRSSAFYELEDTTWGTYASHGFAVIANAPGVQAVLRVNTAPHPTNRASWSRTMGYDAVEFRSVGAFGGLVIDRKNIEKINLGGSKYCLVTGVHVTNSIGTSDTVYWNNNPPPAFGFDTPGWWQFSKWQYAGNPTYQKANVFHDTENTYADVHSHTRIVYHCNDKSTISTWQRTARAAMTIQYVGAGTGTIQKIGANAGAGAIRLVDPAGTSSDFNLGLIDNPILVSQVVAFINARANWTASLVSDTIAARHMQGTGFGDENSFGATVANAGLAFETFQPFHGDGTQTDGGEENLLYWGWTITGDDTTNNLSAVFFFDGLGYTNGDRDMSFVNCAINTTGANSIGFGGPGAHQILFRHVSVKCWVAPQPGAQSSRNKFRNSIINGIGAGDPSTMPAVDMANILHTIPNGASGPTGSSYVNFTSLGFANGGSAVDPVATCCIDPANGNFRPKGPALTHLAAPDFPVDLYGTLRDPVSDCFGAVSRLS